jgi:Ca2+-binding EF-hand superfamily protein
MTDKKTENESLDRKDPKQVRVEIREYIRNERDTILKKWMALKESIASEDSRREQFYRKKEMEDTKSLPINVLKFIGTMKKSVRNTMRYKGGTAYSVVRSMFTYWDASKTGLLTPQELFACMKSLGSKVTLTECEEIVRFYTKPGQKGMNYHELLQDLVSGEPSIIAYVTQQEDLEKSQNEIRFEEVNDKFAHQPMIVKKFLEAVRNFLATKMRHEGGTPFQHIRHLFQFYDYDYSNGLDHKELITAARRTMKLAITEEQACQIVDFYDRKQIGEINCEKFLEDVCADVLPILTFVELTPRSIAEKKVSLSHNPFIPKPFSAPSNRILEKFKSDIRSALVVKVNKLGGSVASWIREAFVNWDRGYTGKISDWRHLQGAAQRLGVTINEEGAKALMSCYDRFHTGEMHYQYFAEEIMKESPHFLTDPGQTTTRGYVSTMALASASVLGIPPPHSVEVKDRLTTNLAASITQRTPANVQKLLDRLKHSAEKFTKKSKGCLEAKDVLHGTFLRFDAEKRGRVTVEIFRRVTDELRANIDSTSLNDACKWFDTDGSNQVDYNELTRQMFGADVINERLTLPKLKESVSTSSLKSSNSSLLTSSNSAINLPYLSVAKASTMQIPSPFGVPATTMEKNLDVVESVAVKNARMKQKRLKILAEKVKVERKLATIEEQRKQILDDYKVRKAGKEAFSNSKYEKIDKESREDM